MFERIFHGSIRKKLTLIVLLATLPVILGHIGTEIFNRRDAVKSAEYETTVFLRGFSELQNRISASTRTLLQTIAAIPAVQNLNAAESKIILRTILDANPIYTNVLLLDSNGNVLASGGGNPKGLNFADRKQFKDAIHTRKFSAGEYVVGKVTHKAIFPFAMPVLNSKGVPHGAIIIGVNLSHYGDLFERGDFPKDSFFGVCDHNGNRLFRFPPTPNTKIGSPIKADVFGTASMKGKSGTLVTKTTDNVTRVVAYEPIRLESGEKPYMYMFMGLNQSNVLGKANSMVIRGAITFSVSLFFAIIIAWVLGGKSIDRNLEKLTSVVNLLGKDDVKSPSGIDYSDGEIGHLAQAFDKMLRLLRLREIERNQALYRLGESEEQSRILLDTNPSGICLVNPDNWLIEFANPAFMNLFSLKSEDLGGLCLDDLHPVKEFVSIKSEYEKHFQRKISFSPAVHCLSHSGHEMVIDISSAIVTIQDRELLAGFFTDITERKQTESYILQAEKMMTVGGLAAGMAHEINNPLSAIMGSAQNLQNRILTDSAKNREVAETCGTTFESVSEYLEKREAPKMISTIGNSVRRAADIVTKMIRFSRKSEHQTSSCDIAKLLDSTLELAASDYDLKKNYDFKRFDIVREYESELPSVLCDSTQIQQVFLNVFKNAAEAMTDKTYEGESPRFTLRVRKEQGMVVVDIEDNGPGMNEDVVSHVFEPFYTTKSVGEGTGLGLSVSYFIVTDQHNGQMLVDSSLGEWTKFIIKLPLAIPSTRSPAKE